MVTHSRHQKEDDTDPRLSFASVYIERHVQIPEQVHLLEETPDRHEDTATVKHSRRRRQSRSYIMRAFSEVLGLDEAKTPKFAKAIIAEIIGTAILVLGGCGSVATLNSGEPAPTLAVAFAFGLSLAVAVWAFGHISGGHVNPSVTLAFLVTGNHTIIKSACYILAQCAGSCLGAGIAWGCVPEAWRGNLGSTTLADGVDVWQGLLVEGVSTFLLVLTVFASCDRLRTDHSGSIALTIGLCVTSQICWMGTVTGGSMNPARSFGPALVSGTWRNHWIYWIAPITGGIIAGLVYEHVYAEETQETDSGLRAFRHNKGVSKAGGFLDYTIEIEAPKEETDTDTLQIKENGILGANDIFIDPQSHEETRSYKEELTPPQYVIDDVVIIERPGTISTSGYDDDSTSSKANDESMLVIARL